MNVPDLHVHTTYSISDGMGTPEDVVKRAKALGWGAAALTEHGWMGSAPTFYKACIENGIKPILGCEMYVIPSRDEEDFKGKAYHLTVLALTKEGYFNLVAWLTYANDRENFHRFPKITVEEMITHAPYSLENNVVLSGCIGGELAACALAGFESGRNGSGASGALSWLAPGIAYVDAMRSAFPHFYLEFQNHRSEKRVGRGFTAYENLLATESAYRGWLQQLAEISGCPTVVTNDSHFQSPNQRSAHLAMLAASWRNRSDTHYGTSGEHLISTFTQDYVYFTNYMRSMEKVADGFQGGRQALSNVQEIVDEADIVLDPLDKFNYSIPFSGYSDPVAKIRKRSAKRLEKLRKKHGQTAVDRFEHELNSMESFAHYLLMMSDFIIYARKQGILTNTRGSAANSLLCYCLKIHNIDPIEYKLTFSRFFNPARKKLPDIDVDIEQERYEDFMAYVQ